MGFNSLKCCNVLPAIIVFISCWVCITNNDEKKKSQASHTFKDNTQLSVKSHFTWVDFKVRNIYWTLHSEYFKYMHCTCAINLSGRQMETIKANVSDMICFKVRVVQAFSHPTYYMQIILMRYLPLNLVLSADLFLLYLPSHWPLV